MKKAEAKGEGETPRWSDIFIHRPVLAWVLNIAIVIVGVSAFFKLAVRQYPRVEYPVITISTQFEGAGPEIIEAQITRPLEEALAGLEGLDTMSSESIAENSKVKLFFSVDRSIDSAAADVRDKLSRMDRLPQEATLPRITKADADADPVVSVALFGPSYETPALHDYATRYLQMAFESIQGVASVEIYGGTPYEMHLILDPVRMASYNLTAQEVSEALKHQNITKPAGRIGEENREYLIITRASMTTPEEFNNLVLAEREGYLVKIKDIGRAELRSENKRFQVLYNGQAAIMMDLVAQSRSNPIEIAHQVKEKLQQLRENLPQGMSLEIANDKSVFIKRSIHQVYQAILEAIVLVVVVIFLFLRSFRASVIPLITIPVSLLGGIFFIYLLGFTLNTFTLLALVLAVGLVVDDAIVVLENIYRHIEEGIPPFRAAIQGTREILFSVIAMTLTLAAVYTPISLASGITGKLFTEFALTLVGAVLWSGFVALVLSPMMCARLLKPASSHQHFSSLRVVRGFQHAGRGIEAILDHLDTLYSRGLGWALSRRFLILLGALGLGVGGYLLSVYFVPSELSPREDQGILRVTAQSPFGANLNYLEKYARAADLIVSKLPEVEKRLLIIQAGDETYERITLVPPEKRPRCQAMVSSLMDQLGDIPGFRAYAYCPSRSPMGGSSERPLELLIQTNRPFKDLVVVASRVRYLMSQTPGVRTRDIEWNVAASGKEYEIKFKRDVAAASNVDIQNVAVMLDMLISGRKSTSFEKDSKLYPVRVWMKEADRKSPQDLKSLMVKGRQDRREVMIPLQDFVTIEEKVSNPAINHHSGMRSVLIMAGLEPGYGLGEVYGTLKPQIRELLPAGFLLTESGELKRFFTEKQTIFFIFGLAIVFIFLVMAAQFESFRDPFIIMFSVPLALAGAVFTLWIVPGGTINIYSQVGFVTLIGLITKHGILVVDFANKIQEEGHTPVEAILQACRLRLRPILMTTMAMVLGALPLAISSGPGYEIRRQIGWVIVGGMTLGTFFTLFVVPLVYTLISNRHRRLSQEKLLSGTLA